MRILLTGYPTLGGSGYITTKLGQELANRGHDVHFLFYKKPFFLDNTDLENITFHKIDRVNYALFRDIGTPYTLQAASKIAEVVKNHDIDILHSHYAIPHAVASYLASQISPVSTLITTHGSDTHTLGRETTFNQSISLALRNSTHVSSVSDYLSRETENVFNLPPKSVSTVYDFVNTDIFTPHDVERENSIIQASNFRPIKQIPLLIKLFAEVASEFPHWKLKLVGDGPDLTESIRTARRAGIRDQVEFLGIRRDIPELFCCSGILGSTSSMESFGLTIAEAMSCETPIWAPRVGGIPEVCEDGKTGFLYDFADQEGAVDRLAKMMTDESIRLKFGKAARQRIKEKFSVNPILEAYERLYESIIPVN